MSKNVRITHRYWLFPVFCSLFAVFLVVVLNLKTLNHQSEDAEGKKTKQFLAIFHISEEQEKPPHAVTEQKRIEPMFTVAGPQTLVLGFCRLRRQLLSLFQFFLHEENFHD